MEGIVWAACAARGSAEIGMQMSCWTRLVQRKSCGCSENLAAWNTGAELGIKVAMQVTWIAWTCLLHGEGEWQASLMWCMVRSRDNRGLYWVKIACWVNKNDLAGLQLLGCRLGSRFGPDLGDLGPKDWAQMSLKNGFKWMLGL